MIRTILHVDFDAFFCSVEELLRPDIKGRAFVVGGTPEGRGVVASASYPARKYGVRSAMPTSRALRLCPGLLVLPPRSRVYSEKSGQVMDLLREVALMLEQVSIDEAFLDVSGDSLPGGKMAEKLQKEVQERFGLPTSWGVASNKLVAKIATEVGKPMGIIVVPPGQEATFLSPLPVAMLWGVGPKTQEQLKEMGIETIGDLARYDQERLAQRFGEMRGKELATRALGIDERSVVQSHEAQSMSAETTYTSDIAEVEVLRSTLRQLSEGVGRRLRRAGLAGNTVRLKLRWPDFTTITRQTRLDQPTNQDGEIYRAALGLFQRYWRAGHKVRLLGVAVSGLKTPARQLNMFDRAWEHDARLLNALDNIRARFGPRAVRRGAPPEGQAGAAQERRGEEPPENAGSS